MHEPSRLTTAQKHLVVLIHGLGDTPQDSSTHLAELIEGTPARFIAPRGVSAHGSGWRWFAFGRPLQNPPQAVLTQTRFPPIRALHGAADSLIPLSPTQDLVKYLQSQGLDARLQAYPGDEHVISSAMIRDVHKQLRQLLNDS